MDSSLRYHWHDNNTSDREPDDYSGIVLHAVDADWRLFLAALLVEWLQCQNLDQGRSLQSGSGR